MQLTVQVAGIWSGTVPGQLQNAIIQSNNTVSMIMVINDQIQTSIGPVQMTANGMLNGVRDASALTGKIQGMVGKVSAMGFSGDFVGQGQWDGSLNGSHGTGVFIGTISFTNSPVPQIPTNQLFPMSGTWSADFSIPVPEFETTRATNMIIFALTAFLLTAIHKKHRTQPNRSDRSE